MSTPSPVMKQSCGHRSWLMVPICCVLGLVHYQVRGSCVWSIPRCMWREDHVVKLKENTSQMSLVWSPSREAAGKTHGCDVGREIVTVRLAHREARLRNA